MSPGLAEDCSGGTLSQLPDYQPYPVRVQKKRNIYAAVKKGEAVACLDVQAIPAVRHQGNWHFTEQGLTTVVFAVDRSLTDLRPRTWQELQTAGIRVGLPSSSTELRLILGAAAYGLDEEQSDGKNALAYFEALADRNLLTRDAADCPVRLCLDTEAVMEIQKGEPLTLMVPQDGTLSFSFGVLSEEAAAGVRKEQLLDAGLRLVSGEAEAEGYPSQHQYRAAARVKDVDNFLRSTEYATREIRRSVFHSRYLNSADGVESIFMLTIACLLALFWTASALHRSTTAEMRHWVWLFSGQILTWLLLCLVKYNLPSDTPVSRFCWYGYYIFLMGLPVAMLYVGQSVDQIPEQKRYPVWFRLLMDLYPALVLLVFTNDLHQAVFRFDIDGNWSDEYTRGPVYYIIFTYCILCFLLSFLMLFRKSQRSPKHWASAGPAVVAVLLISYNVAYTLGIPWIRDSNLTLIFCGFSILYLEALLSAGLIPTNTGYQEIFSSTPLKMQLLDPQGETVLRAVGARMLTEDQRRRILTQPQTPFYQDANTLLHSQVIHGGIAVWQEDVTALTALQDQLNISIQRLKMTNRMLHKESYVRRQKVVSEVNNQLFDQLTLEIRGETEQLSRVVRELPCAEDRKKEISYIPLLMCHLKRRCNLFFLSLEGNTVSCNELSVYLDELSEFGSYTGIHALVRCGISGTVPVRQALLFYNFYFMLISWAVRQSSAVLIGQLEQRQEELTFGILSSCSTDTLAVEPAFLEEVQKAGGRISRKMVDEAQGIYLCFSGGNDL